VDTSKKAATAKTSNSTKMADDTQQPDKLDKIITLLTALMQKESDENETAAKAKLAADDKAKQDAADAEKKDEAEKMAASVDKAVELKLAAIRKDMLALGIKTGVAVTGADDAETKAAIEAAKAAEAAKLDPQ